jgi:hypothetical protein
LSAVRAAGLGVALLCWVGVLPAQTMRPFTTYRQLHAENRLAARLEFAAGRLRVAPGSAAELYRMTLAYDADRFVPLSRYDAPENATTLGVEPVGGPGLRVVSRHQLQQDAVVLLSPQPDLSLDVSLGAVEADLDLGGLRLTELRLEAGASRSVVRFSQPNAVRCRTADISAGAAEVSILKIGNSRCDRVRIEGGIGRMTLDFGGAWTGSQRADLSLAVTELRLRLPRQAGVRITMDRFLASFEPTGLVRRGNRWETPGYEQAERKLDLALKTTVGGVRIDWTD